jgi:predicted nuclease of predicted toxin-antitoxin system
MIGFYFDEHISRDAAEGLMRRGIEVVMAVDVDMTDKDDDTEHLPYATQNQLVMVTMDRPFAGRTVSRTDHNGLICLDNSMQLSVGRIVNALTKFTEEYTPEMCEGQVFWVR